MTYNEFLQQTNDEHKAEFTNDLEDAVRNLILKYNAEMDCTYTEKDFTEVINNMFKG